MTAMDCHREGVLDIPMLILKYDQYRISTENAVCLYLGLLISSSKIEVLLYFM